MNDVERIAGSMPTRRSIAARLQQVRLEIYGENGGPLLARRLGIPWRTWAHYEAGVSIPAEVLLQFIELTGVEPRWLLRGTDEPFRAPWLGGMGRN